MPGSDTPTRGRNGSPIAVLPMFVILFRSHAFGPGQPSPEAAVMILFRVAFGGFFFGLTYGERMLGCGIPGSSAWAPEAHQPATKNAYLAYIPAEPLLGWNTAMFLWLLPTAARDPRNESGN